MTPRNVRPVAQGPRCPQWAVQRRGLFLAHSGPHPTWTFRPSGALLFKHGGIARRLARWLGGEAVALGLGDTAGRKG